MTDATPPPDRTEASPTPPTDPGRPPAHRARLVAAAVSAGAFAGIGLGLLVTQAGDDADPAPISATGDQPRFGDVPSAPTDPFGGGADGRGGNGFAPPDAFGGDADQGGTPQLSPPDSGGTTPTPFGGQSGPDTNSGGS
ncbi:MAG: hypothetical protein H6518_02390 [Microthrixaceae bacterium]|nr:hypothetical protein [Microthrixaceae bacterium]